MRGHAVKKMVGKYGEGKQNKCQEKVEDEGK
jgi:hypothetical protein